MKILDIAKKSKLTISQLEEIANEFDESIYGMTRNVAQFHLINTLERMMNYGDLYVYEGRYPKEEPEIMQMSKDLLTYARCVGRIRHEQLLCNYHNRPNQYELITKSYFYYLVGEYYNELKTSKNLIKKQINIKEYLDLYLIKDMRDIEYKEWGLFLKICFSHTGH